MDEMARRRGTGDISKPVIISRLYIKCGWVAAFWCLKDAVRVSNWTAKMDVGHYTGNPVTVSFGTPSLPGACLEIVDSLQIIHPTMYQRCLWDIRAEETTIDGRWTNLEPQLNISALVSLLVETRNSSLTAGEFLSLLFCLAGDQVAVYFRAQVIDELNTLLLCDDIIRQWDAALVSHCGSEGLIKLKRKINVIDDRPANRRCMVNRDRSESVLGKRNSLDFMPAEGQPSPKRSASGGSERPQLPCDPPQLSLLVNYNA